MGGDEERRGADVLLRVGGGCNILETAGSFAVMSVRTDMHVTDQSARSPQCRQVHPGAAASYLHPG